MVAPGFLESPEVRRWLNGVEPAWTMLEFNSLNALRHEPSGSNHAIRLEPDLADAEISGSAVTTTAWTLAGSLVPCRTLAHEPCLFPRIPARFLAPERSGGHPVVAFGIGTRLAAERDTHAAFRASGHRCSEGAVGFRFQCHGGSHSP